MLFTSHFRISPFIISPFVLALAFLCLPALALADSVRGQVVDPQVRPVVGAEVMVLRGNTVVAQTLSIADGMYGPIALEPGTYTLVGAANGLRSRPVALTILAGTDIQVAIILVVSAVEETVVVSAAQVDTLLTRVTDSVTVIDRAALITRQAESVVDAFRLVPGFGVSSNGGRGALTSLFPRGGESDYTLVLVDGLPQNVFGGGFDAAHLATADVDRIEVVRGPQSALFGGGAIGGVVHVITQHGGPPAGQVSIEGGGYRTWRATGSARGSHGPWQWGAGIDWLASDGDARHFDSIGQRVDNDDYERVGASGSVTWSDGPGFRVRLDVRVGRNERGNPGPYGSNPIGAYAGLDLVSRGINTSRAIAMSGSLSDGTPTRHRAQATWSDLKSEFASPFGASEDRTRRLTGRYQFDLNLPRFGMSSGSEVVSERADNTFVTGTLFQPVPVSRSITGWFAEARPWLGSRAFMSAGVRVERIERSALEENPSAFGPRPAFKNEVIWSVNPKISAAWLLGRPDEGGWTKLRAGAGTGIKPPTVFEIAFTDNPRLAPERSRSFDVGIEQAFWGSAVVADATWFHNRYDDLIVAVGGSYSGASRYRTDNIANARARGVEVGVRWQSARGLAGRAAWTWLDAEVLGIDNAPNAAPAPFAVGDRLIRRPRHQGSVEVVWSASRGNAFVSINGRGAVLDLEPNYGAFGGLFEAPGYTTVSLGGAVTIRHGLEVYGRVTNAFDRSYEDALGFPALGRAATVGVRVSSRQ